MRCERCKGYGREVGLGNIPRDCFDCKGSGFLSDNITIIDAKAPAQDVRGLDKDTYKGRKRYGRRTTDEIQA